MSTSGERTEHSGQLAGPARKAAAAKMPGMLSRRRVITILGAVAGLPILPAGDEPNNVTRLHRWRGTALGSPSYILLHHPDRGAAEQAVAQCVAEIERLEKKFSLYRGDSEITRLNRHGRLESPSHDFLALLSECQRFSELSGGAFDVTVQPLWNVYAAHFFGSESPSPQGPEPRIIEQALALVDWQGVDLTSRHIALARSGMGLTLNGIAQGYLTDRIADILRHNGCDRVLADMGRSEILLVGHRGMASRPRRSAGTRPGRRYLGPRRPMHLDLGRLWDQVRSHGPASSSLRSDDRDECGPLHCRLGRRYEHDGGRCAVYSALRDPAGT